MADPSDDEPREYASSPCMLHEVEAPSLTTADIVKLLNELTEGERAGAKGVLAMADQQVSATLKALLHEVAEDEARFCAMLYHHVERLGGEPNRTTGIFAEKLVQRETLEAKLKLLDKGQSVVVQMLNDAIPRITDQALVADLTEMRDVHVVNIQRCNALLPAG